MSTDGCRGTPYPKLHETDRVIQSEVASLNDTSLLRMQLLAPEGLHTSAEFVDSLTPCNHTGPRTVALPKLTWRSLPCRLSCARQAVAECQLWLGSSSLRLFLFTSYPVSPSYRPPVTLMLEQSQVAITNSPILCTTGVASMPH